MNWVGTAFIAVIACCAATSPGNADVVMRSTAPYWQVGPRDTALSATCSVGRFNEQEQNRYTVEFTGKIGAATLGLAKGSGLNLRDPDHHAHTEEDYYFRDDGTSSCQVFVGGRKPPVDPNAPAGGATTPGATTPPPGQAPAAAPAAATP